MLRHSTIIANCGALPLYNKKINRRRPRRPAGLVPEASPAEGEGGDTYSTRKQHERYADKGTLN